MDGLDLRVGERLIVEGPGGGRSVPQVRAWEVLLPAALGWILAFLAAAFAVHRRRDL